MDENADQDSKVREAGIGADWSLEEALSANIDSTLERLLAPIVQVERLKRREYLTTEEVELVYGLKAATLANKRSRAQGPEYIKDGDKILYRQRAIKAYLDTKTIKTGG